MHMASSALNDFDDNIVKYHDHNYGRELQKIMMLVELTMTVIMMMTVSPGRCVCECMKRYEYTRR